MPRVSHEILQYVRVQAKIKKMPCILHVVPLETILIFVYEIDILIKRVC